MLYGHGNNCDTDNAEYYVNHLMVAVLRELDTLYCIIVQSRTTMAASWRDAAGLSPRNYKNRGSAWITQRASILSD